MKRLNQLCCNPNQAPDLIWSLEGSSFTNENRRPSKTRAHEYDGKAGLAVSPVVIDRDWTLIAQFHAGNEEAFEQLVLRHKDRVYTLAYRVLGDRSEADDVAQETFLRAYERLTDFRREARFSTWLHRICHNLCVNRLQKKNCIAHEESAPEAVPSLTIGSCEQLLAKEQQHLLNWALSRLKAEFREIVLLYNTDHLSYEEIASVLGQPIGTVRSRLHRGREELKTILRPYFVET